jgi:aryl-alcohol dehydrogenase-like predicted oxidoreductase
MNSVNTLEAKPLGDSGIDVSAIGLGCNNLGWRIDARQTQRVVDAALDAGINFFDTADMYGKGASETELGAALGARRSEVTVATKFGHRNGPDFGVPKGSAAHVRRATEDSLTRLNTDYIDLQYQHSPDASTPIEETLEELWRLMDEGKIRAIGCSNFDADQIRGAENAARAAGRPHFCVLQSRYNIIDRSAAETLIPLCREYGMGFVPWYPLASGLLTGKYTRGEAPPEGSRFEAWSVSVQDDDWDRAERAAAFADRHGATLLETALSGLASEPEITSIIAGATRPEQLSENIRASARRFSDGELTELHTAVGRA